MKKIWIFLLLLVCSEALFAQVDVSNIKALKKLISQYQYNDSAKAFYYARQGLTLSLKSNDSSETWYFYHELGRLSRQKNDYPKALYFFKKELAFAQKKGNASNVILSYRDLGLVYQAESSFIEAQRNFLLALGASENEQVHSHIGLIYDDIASVYFNENQLTKSTEYLDKAAAEGDKKDTLAVEKEFEIRGAIEYQNGHAEKARNLHSRALKLYQKQHDSIGEATMYMQIASTYDGSYNNARQCIAYCFKSKNIWDKTNPGSVYAQYNLDNLSMAYWDMAQYLDTMPLVRNRKVLQRWLANKAKHSFKEAYRLSRMYSNSIAALFALDNLAKVESYEGDKATAYENIRLYTKIHDSLYSQQNISKLTQLENQRQIDLRDKQLQIKRLQLANQKKQTILLIGFLAVVVLIAIVIYVQSRYRKRVNMQLSLLNKELDEANSVKTKFFGILNHDLKRPVADLVTFRRLQQIEPCLFDNDSRQEYDDKITASAEHLLTTMDDLLLWSKGQMQNFKPQFQRVSIGILFSYIKKSFAESQMTIVFTEDANDLVLITDEHYLKTIMLNLTNNAAYSLSHTNSPLIEWTVSQNGPNSYLAITDNGPGANEEKFRPLYDADAPVGTTNGLGLHIIRDLAKAIECEVELDTKRAIGIRIKLKFSSKK